MTLDELARERRVIVCLGGGGVGKTTIAAALALAGARAGRRAVVVTVDPARRLADALGGGALSDEPRPVPGGRFEAAMLDQKRAWDQMVARHARTPEVAERLLHNRLYHELSASFAGTHEYLAVERLGALVDGGAHDLVVLDTPPASQAVEIFDAPGRLRGFLDRRLLGWLSRSGPLRAAGRMARFVASEVEIAVGPSALTDAVDFFSALGALLEGFESRARQLETILRLPSTALVLVVAPDGRAIDEARLVAARAEALGARPAAVVMNRMHVAGPPAADADIVAALRGIDTAHRDWLVETYLDHQRLATSEAQLMGSLRSLADDIICVPELERDAHDLEGLAMVLASENPS